MNSRRWELPFCLFALVAAVYSLAPATGFLYDDHEVIQNHPGPATLAETARIFAERHWPDLPYYRPITRTTLLVQKSIWGEDPAPFRYFNAALMGLAAVLAYLLLRLPALAFAPQTAAFAAALFALHPAASSCVYPISSGRESLMPAVWILAAIYAWLRPGWRAKLAAYAAFVCALLSKEQAVVLPLLFVLADVLALAPDAPRREVERWAVRYAPLLPIVAGYLMVRHALFGSTEYVFAGWSGPPVSLLYALQNIFVPFAGLRYEPEFAVWWSPVRLGIALAALAALVMYVRRGVAFWLGWFVLALLPTANLLRQEAPYDERYIFLASLGVFALAARALPRWAGVAVVVVAAVISVERAQYFRDDVVFSRQWLATNPRSVNAEYNLGFSMARLGDHAGAVEHYGAALRLRPDYAFAHNNLANTLVAEGRVPEAIPHFREAVRLDPAYFDAYFNMGIALCQSGEVGLCIEALERAAVLRPQNATAAINLGNAYAARGDIARAKPAFERALALAPDSAEAHSNYAVLLAGAGRIDDAVVHLREALRLNPNLEDARRNLTALLATQGK